MAEEFIQIASTKVVDTLQDLTHQMCKAAKFDIKSAFGFRVYLVHFHLRVSIYVHLELFEPCEVVDADQSCFGNGHVTTVEMLNHSVPNGW